MRLPLTALVVAAVTSFAAVAGADIPSPEHQACLGKSVGDPCTLAAGDAQTTCPCTCTSSTCGTSQQGPDGGYSWVSYPCGACQSDGRFADAGTDAGTGAPAATSSGGCGVSRMGPLAGAFGIAMALPLLLRRRRRT
jgi:hypothetical protein